MDKAIIREKICQAPARACTWGGEKCCLLEHYRAYQPLNNFTLFCADPSWTYQERWQDLWAAAAVGKRLVSHALWRGAFWLLLERSGASRKKWNLTGLLSKGQVVTARDGLFLWSALLIIHVGRNCFSWAVTDTDIQTVNETPSV